MSEAIGAESGTQRNSPAHRRSNVVIVAVGFAGLAAAQALAAWPIR